jgi:hypothetical protein
MEKLELTAPDLIKTLNWSKSKVYYWMNTGKFETIETPEGLKVKITQAQIDNYRKKESCNASDSDFEQFENVQKKVESVQEIPESSNQRKQENFNNSQTTNNEVMLEAINTIRYMFDNQLNQTKLIADSEKRTQDEYFKISVEFKTLQEKLKLLELENLELKKENEQLKSKSFFNLFKK